MTSLLCRSQRDYRWPLVKRRLEMLPVCESSHFKSPCFFSPSPLTKLHAVCAAGLPLFRFLQDGLVKSSSYMLFFLLKRIKRWFTLQFILLKNATTFCILGHADRCFNSRHVYVCWFTTCHSIRHECFSFTWALTCSEESDRWMWWKPLFLLLLFCRL